jgi:hypothetical protein
MLKLAGHEEFSDRNYDALRSRDFVTLIYFFSASESFLRSQYNKRYNCNLFGFEGYELN